MTSKLEFPSVKRNSKTISYNDALALKRIIHSLFSYHAKLVIKWDDYNNLEEEDFLNKEPDLNEPYQIFFLVNDNTFNVALLAVQFKYEGIKPGVSGLIPIFVPGMSVAQFITNLPGVLEYINAKLGEIVERAYKG